MVLTFFDSYFPRGVDDANFKLDNIINIINENLKANQIE